MQPLHHDDPRRIGPYKLLGRLGDGGMGEVYLAKGNGHSRVAVKVIKKPHAGKENYRRRFEHEIANARKVNSPYVAKILDSNTKGATWWYASEYVPGLNILQAVERNGGFLAVDTVRKLVVDLAEALQSIHAAGVVHRDLKPQNVIINAYGAKVIDFGIAISAGAARLTTVDHVVGTPAFMCVGQMRDDQPSPSWDLFALGGLIIYASTGLPPFYNPDVDKGMHDIQMNILNGKPPYLDAVPAEFHGLVNKCLDGSIDASQVYDAMAVKPISKPQHTLFLTQMIKTAVREWPYVHAMKPVPRPRRTGESNKDWAARNLTYIHEMEKWNKAARAQRRANRRIPLFAKFVVLLAICGLAYYYHPLFPGWWGELKKHIPTQTAEAAPNTQSLPDNKPSVPLPQVSFGAGKPGQTYDPDNKSSYIKVDSIDATGYQVTVSATAIGYEQYGDLAFSDSCVRVVSGKSAVTVYPTAFQATGEQNGQLTGKMVFSTVFRGSYTFYPACNQDRSVRGVTIGNVGNVNKGILHSKGSVVPVMGTELNGSDLTISVIPDDHGGSQYCFRSPTATKRPSAVKQSHIGDIVFTELTFRGVGAKGTLYTSCSEKNHNVTFPSGGVKIK